MLQLRDTLEGAEAKLSHQITDLKKKSRCMFEKEHRFPFSWSCKIHTF